MRIIFHLLFLASSLTSLAQKKGTPQFFAKSITQNDLKKHLTIIAGAEMEGRETGTEGQRKAAAYLESQFKQIGLEPANKDSYQMFFNLYQDSITEATLEVNGQAFTIEKDFSPAVSNLTAPLRFSEVVFIGSALSDSLKNANLAGRLVMMALNNSSNSVVEMLQSKGAAGILYVSSAFPGPRPLNRKARQGIDRFFTRLPIQQYVTSETVAKAILKDEYEKVKGDRSIVKTYAANIFLESKKTTLTVEGSNVMGVLRGSDLSDEYLFITAHYDHLGKRDSVIYYGADDDGSGTVAVLELAEAFVKAKAAGKGPRRSIVFMAVSGEEKGLLGSAYYGNNPVYPFDKTTADLNIDMIGRSDTARKGDTTNYVYVVGDDKISSELKPLSEGINNKNTKLQLDYKFNDPKDINRIYYRSDHYNFAKHGVPIIFYYDGMLGADYHRPTDTVDKINFPLLLKRANLIFYTAWEIANRSKMLVRDIPLN